MMMDRMFFNNKQMGFDISKQVSYQKQGNK